MNLDTYHGCTGLRGMKPGPTPLDLSCSRQNDLQTRTRMPRASQHSPQTPMTKELSKMQWWCEVDLMSIYRERRN